MIVAGYELSTMSGATPITLVTTLTHVMLGDERIATFQSQTDDTPKTIDDDKLIYHIADHLNSSSLDLSNTGLVLQAVDYLPFGQSNTYEVTTKRVKGKKGGYANKYKFANKQEDPESDLQYFEKRYYDNRIGRFTTEDPVYWEVGLTKRPNQYFTDPQQWNSYSYVRNNPINLVDPTGETSNPGQQFMDVLWQFYDAGYRNITDDVKSEAKTYQQVATTTGNAILQNAPGTGDMGDAYALVTGKDLYTGEDVSGITRLVSGITVFVPGVSGSEMRGLGKPVINTILSNTARIQHAFDSHASQIFGSNKWSKYSNEFKGIIEKTLSNPTTVLINQSEKRGSETFNRYILNDGNRNIQVDIFTSGNNAGHLRTVTTTAVDKK